MALKMVNRSAEELVGDASRIALLVPAYNEERYIGSIVLKAKRRARTVIVVDDGSEDATAEIAMAAGAVVVRHESNRGKGAALNTGFSVARGLKAEALVVMDGDGQHRVEEIPTVAAPVLAGQTDIAVGSRYLEPTSRVPRHRVLGHWAFNLITRQASGVAASDSQSGFRAFSTRALELLSFSSNGFSVESEMQFLARERHLRMAEVPITITYFEKPKRPVLAHGAVVLNGILLLIGQYRPLLFMGMPGFLCVLAGIFWGLRVVDLYQTTRTLAVGYALISVLLCVGGLVALSTGVILHSVRGLLLELLGARART
ncbi:MAG: glycosyltransferase family 2 protein [Chloroflexota bacterium]